MRMNLRLVVLAAVVACVAGTASRAHAQGNSLFGASGPMSGGSGTGTATTGNTVGTMQSSAFPTSAFGAPPAGGAAGAGGMGMGAGGAMGGQPGMAGAAGQQGGMVGQRNTRFVGNAQAGQTTPGQNGQMNNRQGQNRNNTRRTGQNANQTNQAGGGAGNQQQKSVRPQMVVAFDHPIPTAEKTQTALTTRFEKLANKTQFKGIDIEVNGSRVILRGEVANAQDSKLAQILARLEPGVRTVQNELTVTPGAAPGLEE